MGGRGGAGVEHPGRPNATPSRMPATDEAMRECQWGGGRARPVPRHERDHVTVRCLRVGLPSRHRVARMVSRFTSPRGSATRPQRHSRGRRRDGSSSSMIHTHRQRTSISFPMGPCRRTSQLAITDEPARRSDGRFRTVEGTLWLGQVAFTTHGREVRGAAHYRFERC